MKYYIIAGEASGDLHGANLIKALRTLDPEAQIRFWGGDAMAALAGTPVRHIRDLAIMGFIEVIRHLPTVLSNITHCKQDIAAWRPDALIGIDYPGFNLRIEGWAHKQGIRTIHYISPQLWAWKKGRLKGMRRNLDSLCYILPFEQQFYATNHMPQATYVGHPLIDAISQWNVDNKQQLAESQLPTIALLPGSRRQEIQRSLPYMIRLARRHPEYNFSIAGLSILGENYYQQILQRHNPPKNLTLLQDQTYQLLSQSYAAVVCSGTATLETALFNVPQVVCYRANPITIALARALVGRRINHIALVDLIDDSDLVIELLQNDFNDQRLEQEFQLITTDQQNRRRILDGYQRVRQQLGSDNASLRTAQTIIQIISHNQTK